YSSDIRTLDIPSFPTRRSSDLVEGRSINQIDGVIEQIKKNPDSRRLIVSAWNVGELDQMALPPCHALFQFFVQERELSCQLYQRDRKSTRLNSSHGSISYAVFC